MSEAKPLWTPSQDRIEGANVTRFARQAMREWKVQFRNYPDYHRWSVEHSDQFWRSVWRFCEVQGDPGKRTLIDGNKMPGAKWFPDARLNFAQNLLRRRDTGDALVFWGEDKVKRTLSFLDLYDEVARVADSLRQLGVKPGDRVAGYLPNMPETIIALLAASSIGAIWSSCSPDFGVQGVLDRFGQIEPVVLFTVDAYWYSGKVVDVMPKVRLVADKLPSLKCVVVVPYAGSATGLGGVPNVVTYQDFTQASNATEIAFEQLPFDHPLVIMYSSGTTGVPKCIVHGAGGTLLQHMKEHQLHSDLRQGDRLFYFTTCGWMMWNWLVTGLATGATLCLYDGSPFVRRGNVLWDFADATDMTHFGTSAKYIDHIAKIRVEPMRTHKLKSLRAILSTGSPLVPESFDYVYRAIKKDVCLSSISGGTDIISCFIVGNPILPVWRGELQCLGMGLAVDVFDDDGRPVRGAKGELVCTKPFPSMPIYFWNDPEGTRYRAAYFERFPNIWCHGDYCEMTEHDGILSMIIYGRSDATLNPGGVRIGTAEIYRQVEQLDEVLESLVIGQDWDNDVRVVLFVKLREDLTLDSALIARIKERIKTNTTSRHVPDKVVQVADIPRTKSNKIVELAVRHVVHGRPVKNVEALANPEALEYFRNRVELAS
jgi:acetoacetyl-CoA synthetase